MYTAALYKGITTVKEIHLPSNLDRITMKQKFADEALKLAITTLKESRLAL